MWCWKELRKPYKLVWNGHPKPNGITVMLFLFTIPCTTAHLMKCALTNMRLIRSKPSTQICATTWNDWRVNPDVSQEEYNRWLRTCNSLSIVITTDNWPSAASQNMLRTWSTSFVLYLRNSHWKRPVHFCYLLGTIGQFVYIGRITTILWLVDVEGSKPFRLQIPWP